MAHRTATYGQWKGFLAGRQGILPIRERENIKILCLACGIPVEVSKAMPITVGCIISVLEKVDLELNGEAIEVYEKKYIPTSASGLGCQDCHYLMAKITGLVGKANKRLGTRVTPRIEVDPQEHVNTVQDYWRACEKESHV